MINKPMNKNPIQNVTEKIKWCLSCIIKQRNGIFQPFRKSFSEDQFFIMYLFVQYHLLYFRMTQRWSKDKIFCWEITMFFHSLFLNNENVSWTYVLSTTGFPRFHLVKKNTSKWNRAGIHQTFGFFTYKKKDAKKITIHWILQPWVDMFDITTENIDREKSRCENKKDFKFFCRLFWRKW